MIDIFIAHAWRFHPEWVRLADIIENSFLDTVRNFSLPWHDPAISPNSDYGRNFLHNQLKSQIIPSQYLLFISDLFKVESNLRWLLSCVNLGLVEDKKFVVVGEEDSIRLHVPNFPTDTEAIDFDQFKNWLSELLKGC